MNKILLATRNQGKIREIRAILSDLHLTVESLSDFPNIPEVVEDGKTLEENALKKAREIFLATSIPTLADDTGLEVNYLNMAPGVISARYAGENVSYDENNKKLLRALRGIPTEKRSAQFRCVVVYKDKSCEKIIVGICRGRIIEEPRGIGGFGYDPLFLPDGYNQTFAELALEEKNHISHRARALKHMKEFLAKYRK